MDKDELGTNSTWKLRTTNDDVRVEVRAMAGKIGEPARVSDQTKPNQDNQNLPSSSTLEHDDVILVTGGSGLVGRAIARLIKNTICKFVFLSSNDGDLTCYDQTNYLFRKYRPNYVLNLAAKVGGLYANMSDNESFFKTNTAINENVLRCSKEFEVNKCVSCLSTCIFPAEISYPIDEQMIHLGPPHQSNAGYSMAKRNVDLHNRAYNESCGSTLFTAVIPTNVYGCHDNFNLEQSHVVPGLVHKAYRSAIEAKLAGSNEATLKVCGSGRPLRQFIYAPDLAKLILWVLVNYKDPEPIILCPDEGDELSIRSIAETIARSFSQKYEINMTVSFDVRHSDGQYKKTASNKKLRSLYPNFEFTPFETGIGEVIDWFCSSYPNIRI